MNKKILRVFIAFCVICITSMCFLLNVNAASATMRFTDPTVTVGSKVSVTIDVKGQDIGGYEVYISYDTAYLEYLSSSGGENLGTNDQGGVIKVMDYMSSGSSSKMSCTLTFKTKKTGTTKLLPSGADFTSGGGDPIVPTAVGNSTINIKPVPEASSDATLKSLSIGNGNLSPAFSKGNTDYSVNVDFSVTSLAVTALKNHNGASVYVSGNDNLAVGENKITITVTAENGAKKVYTITVNRAKNPLSSDIFLSLGDGIQAEVSLNISSDLVPRGFELTAISIDGISVAAVSYHKDAMPAVYLLGNDKVSEGFYFADVQNKTAKPFEYTTQAGQTLMILDINLTEIPKGYELGKFKFGEIEKDVLVPSRTETPNHCLVYAVGTMGEKLLYIYDPIENTYQRFSFAEMGKEETVPNTPDETKAPEKQPNDKKDDSKKSDSLFSNKVFKWVFIVIAVVIIVLVVVAIVLGVKYY